MCYVIAGLLGNSALLNENYYDCRLARAGNIASIPLHAGKSLALLSFLIVLSGSPCPRSAIAKARLDEQIAHGSTTASVNPCRLYHKTGHTYTHIHTHTHTYILHA